MPANTYRGLFSRIVISNDLNHHSILSENSIQYCQGTPDIPSSVIFQYGCCPMYCTNISNTINYFAESSYDIKSTIYSA